MECNQRSSTPSGTIDNKSKIPLQFKIPKNRSSVVDQEAGGSSSSAEENININNTRRVCPTPGCNKEFESGKALCGHMRIHAPAVNIHPGSDAENSSMSDQIFPCSLCTRVFPSLKSMFGHMRCHPERDRSGIRQNFSWSLSEDDDEEEKDYGDHDGDMVFDCTQIMPRWPVKGPVKARRGCKGIKRGFFVGFEDEDEDEDEDEIRMRGVAADALLLLNPVMDSSRLSTLGAVAVQQINGGDEHQEEFTNGGSWMDNNREEEFDDMRYVGNGFDEQAGKVNDYDPVPVMRKMAIAEGGSSTDHVMKNYIGSVGQEGNAAAASAAHVVQNHHVQVESDGMNTELVVGGVGGDKHFDGINDKDNHGEQMLMGNSKNYKDKKMKMKMGLNQDKPPAVGNSVQAAGASTAIDKYKCSTCDKTFPSHQALGGHRSSHNKLTVTIINGNGDSSTSKHPFQKLNTSHDQVNRVLMSDNECVTKRNSIDEVGGSSEADHISSTVHQCSVCKKIFASGQALGGHKRCHWTAPAADAQTEAQPQPQAQLAVRSSGEEASTQPGGKRIRLMGFDLNVPASMVDNAAQDSGASW